MSRAIAPAIGVVCFLCVTVLLGGALGTVLLEQASLEPPPQAAVSASADASTGRITLVHRGGDSLDVRTLSLRIEIDGTPLSRQPPVPFFAAPGFGGGPTGPFNVAADPMWTVGEAASVRIASTNAPRLRTGSRVTILVRVRGTPIAEVEASG